MRRRRDTADQLLLAGRFVASGCLDRLCWQSLCFRIFLTCRDSLVLAGSCCGRCLAFLASGTVVWIACGGRESPGTRNPLAWALSRWPFEGPLLFAFSCCFGFWGGAVEKTRKPADVLPGRLQMKRPRVRRWTPVGSKIEPRESQNGVQECS